MTRTLHAFLVGLLTLGSIPFAAAAQHPDTITPPGDLLIVSNTNDDGVGSLRQTILDANNACNTAPCFLQFHIKEPVPPSGWFTIAPLSPLPEVNANYLVIDGATQTGFSGDTNKLGPEIELSGENLTGYASVLTIRHGCQTALRNVAIDNSPGPGLSLLGYASAYDPRTCSFSTLDRNSFEYHNTADISLNTFGLDPTGTLAAPNERGIVGHNPAEFNIHDNVISGNRRSGIFLESPFRISVTNNKIGTTRDGAPLGNGASGIYAAAAGDLYAQALSIGGGNVIAYNQQWGIALNGTTNVAYGGDRIFGNHLTAIGRGLTIGVSPDLFLDSATFDPATGLTTIRGHLRDANLELPEVHLYASFGLGLAGFGEAEEPIGTTEPPRGDATFVFRVQRDLRDKYITATGTTFTTRTGGFTFDTYSESFGLSNAVHVDR
jgi:hypothetical protein